MIACNKSLNNCYGLCNKENGHSEPCGLEQKESFAKLLKATFSIWLELSKPTWGKK